MANDDATSDGGKSLRKLWPLGISLAAPLALFFAVPPLSKSGLWDPFELDVADLSRRIALHVFGASDLAIAGANDAMPHLNDLGRPELPFDSIALGFRLFGLHEWAGRVPLAIWGTLGVLSTYAFVARLVDRRAGMYAALALATMPLFFVQARTMLGDVVTMSALAASFGGLLVAVFDRDDDGPTPLRARAPWLLLGALGLAAGFESRGGVIGLGVPLVAVGLAWGLSWVAGGTRRIDLVGDLLGAIVLVAGVRVVAQGFFALHDGRVGELNLWIGAMIKPSFRYPTFDAVLGQLGPALAPWSAFVPFAFGRLFLAPPARTGPAFQRESHARLALVIGAAVALAAHGWLAARTDLLAFSAPAILAAGCGVAIRDYERGAHPSIAMAVGTAVLLGVLHHDFHELPDRAYQAFAVVGPTFPEGFKAHALLVWTVVLGAFAVITLLTWVERGDAARTPFDPAGYLRIVDSLRRAWDGLLALGYFAVVAGASLAGLLVWVGVKTHAKWLPVVSLQIRDGVLNAWWVAAFVPLGAILGVLFACDVWLWAFERHRPLAWASLTRGFEPFEELYERIRRGAGEERIVAIVVLVPLMVLALPGAVVAYLVTHGTRPIVAAALGLPSSVALFLVLGAIGDVLRGSRAAFFPIAGALTGTILCVSYYPALANQLSPKEVFASYQHARKDGEPLALLGVGGRTSAYYAGGAPTTFTDVPSAYAWLTGGPTRRFLALTADDLPKLNELYREREQRTQPRTNLPILDARSSQILLAASSLAGDTNENPLGKIVLSAPPKPQHRLSVNMDDKLEVLGFDLVDASGRFVDAIAPGRKYRMRTYYRVLAPITTEWQAFIHVEGSARRHNGDHKPMDGKYPLALWLKDDLLVDDCELALEPNFTPGSYRLYFGLYFGCGEPSCRLKVLGGPQDGQHRIEGGPLRVQ